MVRIALLIGAAALSVQPASAQAQATDLTGTGNQLLETCQDTQVFKLMLCSGYVNGVVEGAGLRRVGDQLFCFPEGVTKGQVQSVTVQFLTDHPEKRHMPSYILIAQAMMRAFPCAPKK